MFSSDCYMLLNAGDFHIQHLLFGDNRKAFTVVPHFLHHQISYLLGIFLCLEVMSARYGRDNILVNKGFMTDVDLITPGITLFQLKGNYRNAIMHCGNFHMSIFCLFLLAC